MEEKDAVYHITGRRGKKRAPVLRIDVKLNIPHWEIAMHKLRMLKKTA